MTVMIPRNTTIPTEKAEIYSTAEDNQTKVEIHVLQGERAEARDNRTLGRFHLEGIAPGRSGEPKIKVSFDIDANGILQVTAMDRTTGREQSITIQGASTLSEDEVQQMVRSAQEFAETDRLRKEKIDKRNRSETLIVQSERQLREATLDFGMQFVNPYRSRIEPLIKRLRSSLESNNEREIDIAEADLRDALYDLQREIYDRNAEEKEDGSFFKAVKDFFLDEDDDFYYDNYGQGGYGYNRGSLDYGRGSIGSLPYAGGSPYNRPDPYSSGNRDPYNQGGRDPYNQGGQGGQGGYNQGNQGGGRDNYGQGGRDPYNQGGRDPYNQGGGRDAYDQGGRDNYNQGNRDPYSQSGGRDSYGQDPDRGGYNDRPANPPARGGYDDRSGYNNQSGGYNQGAGNQGGSSSQGSGYDAPRGGGGRPNDDYDQSPRNTRRKPDRPDYSRDNWDQEDDW